MATLIRAAMGSANANAVDVARSAGLVVTTPAVLTLAVWGLDVASSFALGSKRPAELMPHTAPPTTTESQAEPHLLHTTGATKPSFSTAVRRAVGADAADGSWFLHPREHVTVSVLLMLVVLGQVTSTLRHRNYSVHKNMGRVAFVLVAAVSWQLLSRLWRQGPSGLGWPVFLLDALDLVMLFAGYSVAVDFIFFRRDVKVHRAVMMLLAASLTAPVAQRFYSGLLTKSVVAGPFTTRIDWAANPDMVSCALAVTCAYGLATYMAWFSPPYARDVAQARGPGAEAAARKLGEHDDATP